MFFGLYFVLCFFFFFFFFSSRRRHTRSLRDWSSNVCSSDLRHRDRGVADGAPRRCGPGEPGARRARGRRPVKRAALLTAAALALAGCQSAAFAGEGTVHAPMAKREAAEKGLKTAVFAGGCFWGVE